MNKKGLSPVVATVLLISLVIVLAMIVFLWAKYFIPEQIAKSGSPIQDSCTDVNLDVSVDAQNPREIVLINRGNVPVYGVELGKKAGVFGSVSFSNYSGAQYITRAGETNYFPIADLSLQMGDELLVVPILLGEDASTQEKKAFICSDNGQTLKLE